MDDLRIELAASLSDVAPAEWDALAADHPALSHAWLQSLIDSGCTTAETGWQPQFLRLHRRIRDGEALVAALPLYVKSHSYGEYVFDWSWAEAYRRVGIDYYPKLCVAVPFTPCGGPRLLARTAGERVSLLQALQALAVDSGVSSAHVLFADETDAALLAAHGWLARRSVQFHWRNACYADFDAFLSGMNHDKRKRIRQERNRLATSGIAIARKTGAEIAEVDWDFFYRCYVNTYRAHRSTPYLNRAFFALAGARMSEKFLMAIASRDGIPVAASLGLIGPRALYGRYWGATEYVPGLHFELCYYQSIEFCIERGLAVFEGGAQGEHKLARGMQPVACRSFHWIRDARLRNAVADFLMREASGLGQYIDELDERTPFKKS